MEKIFFYPFAFNSNFAKHKYCCARDVCTHLNGRERRGGNSHPLHSISHFAVECECIFLATCATPAHLHKCILHLIFTAPEYEIHNLQFSKIAKWTKNAPITGNAIRKHCAARSVSAPLLHLDAMIDDRLDIIFIRMLLLIAYLNSSFVHRWKLVDRSIRFPRCSGFHRNRF